MDRILLIDGLNSIWRANIAFKPGEKTEPSFVIVYNFFRNLRATIEEFEPTKVFFCLEGSDNFRHKLFPDYKGNRTVKTAATADRKNLDDFYRQADIIVKLISSLPITTVRADKFECDDVIASLAENLKEEEVIVISNDSDFIQLLQKDYKNFKIYNPFTKTYMTAPEYHYLTWKCLAGDKRTDNIPGLVGPGAAEKLATNIDKFAEFMGTHEHRSNYSLNKELIELKMIHMDDLQFTEHHVNYNLLKEEFAKMDCKSMLTEKYWDKFCETFSTLR